MMRTFDEDIERAISFHGHLCGGQLTGVRMARYALNYFGMKIPIPIVILLCMWNVIAA